MSELPTIQHLRRMDESRFYSTDRSDATPEDAIVWLEELTSALSIPRLASYGLDQDQISAVLQLLRRPAACEEIPSR